MTAQKPVMPRALRALETAWVQPRMFLNAFLPLACCFLETSLPFLFRQKSALVRVPRWGDPSDRTWWSFGGCRSRPGGGFHGREHDGPF